MKNSTSGRILSTVLLGGVAAVASCPIALAQAQTTPPAGQTAEPNGTQNRDVVVVTARRVEENIQEVPVAITAISEEELTGRGIVTLTDLQFTAPSLQMTTSFGRLNGGFAVRGLAGGTQTYFAEVPGGPTEASAAFYDIGSVQVLNGPQGTLFGRANTAGAVLITPNRPDLEAFSGSSKIAFGNLGLNRTTSVFNAPLIPGELGVRVAMNTDHLDGYVKAIGTGDRYNENNSWGARLGVDWRPFSGKFKSYTLLDYYDVDQASTAFALVAANTTLPLYNLPADISAPNGLTVGTTRFGAACTTAFNAGRTPSVNQCIDDRLRIAAKFKSAAESEVARLKADDDAWRYTPAGSGLDLSETMEKWTFVNQSEFDFGRVGFTTVQLRNIFGYQSSRGSTGWNVDGLGGLIQSSISVPQTSSYAFTVTAQQDGSRGYVLNGPWQKVYTNETQLRGAAWDGLLDWSIGGYYQKNPGVENLGGIRNLSRVWSGITLATQGYNPSFPFSDGGETTQKAAYGQATVDISPIAPILKSLKLTGGLRKSWDESELFTRGVVTDVATGRYSPSATRSRSYTKSDGENSTLSIDAQITSDLLIYLATRKGYRPGGINSVLNATGLPNYAPTYAPETVEDIEIGAKYDFFIGNAPARLNAALYKTDYTDIQRTFNASVNGVTTTYVVNASAAEISGLELQGQIELGDLALFATYSFTDAEFSRWAGADPLGLITPGNSRCLPQSTSALCLIDLTNNPFPNIPDHQGSLTAMYNLPVDPALGELSLQVSGYAQSRRYFSDAAQRNIEVYGEAVRDALSQPGFARFNARFDWKSVNGTGLSVAAFVNNLTDEGYATGAITQLHSLGTAVLSYAEPRTFGIELRYAFGP